MYFHNSTSLRMTKVETKYENDDNIHDLNSVPLTTTHLTIKFCNNLRDMSGLSRLVNLKYLFVSNCL